MSSFRIEWAETITECKQSVKEEAWKVKGTCEGLSAILSVR
jgi:hypothetical protein